MLCPLVPSLPPQGPAVSGFLFPQGTRPGSQPSGKAGLCLQTVHRQARPSLASFPGCPCSCAGVVKGADQLALGRRADGSTWPQHSNPLKAECLGHRRRKPRDLSWFRARCPQSPVCLEEGLWKASVSWGAACTRGVCADRATPWLTDGGGRTFGTELAPGSAFIPVKGANSCQAGSRVPATQTELPGTGLDPGLSWDL